MRPAGGPQGAVLRWISLLAALVLAMALLVGVAPRGADAALDAEEQAFLTLINDYRAANGLGPLSLNSQLNDAARWLSQDMAANAYLGHIDSLGRDPGQRIAAFGDGQFTALGENVAGGSAIVGFQAAQGVFDVWKNSQGHNAAMLEPSFTVIGIAREYGASTGWWFWTADFGGLLASSTPSPTPTTLPPGVARGDVDCSGGVNLNDAMKLLRYVAALSVGQTEPCPDIGSPVASIFGDIDCDDDIDSVDALAILRLVAGLPAELPPGCPPIG